MVVIISAMMTAFTSSSGRTQLRLDEWQLYGTMAEQGGICAAFARIMELQGILDSDEGKLWRERRNYAGAVIRDASIREGVPAATDKEIDDLIDSYAIWLINGLTFDSEAGMIDPNAHMKMQEVIASTCTELFATADETIFTIKPELQRCSTPEKPTAPDQRQFVDSNQCLPDTSAIGELQNELEILASQNAMLTDRLAALDPTSVVTLTLPMPKPRHVVQLGSYKSYELAASNMAFLQANFDEHLAGIGIDIVTVQIAGSNPFHRLLTQKVGKAKSMAICNALWQSKFSCLLQTNK